MVRGTYLGLPVDRGLSHVGKGKWPPSIHDGLYFEIETVRGKLVEVVHLAQLLVPHYAH